MKETEARIFVISPNSDLTPPLLYQYLISQKLTLKMKETCFGLIVEGKKNAVKELLQKIGEVDKHHIFSKVRAYPPGDIRICRASKGGGPRPGLHFIEFEHQLLPLIGAALESLEAKEKVIVAKPPEEKIVPIQMIRKLIKKHGWARRS
ncbi:MAG: hypothetical protein AOA66_1754 [Candidatus Bathyarchaeota archaeon BA2]|nr:MAG: hypothetical protein AOA66_1754 [Candidatus Bathyarchaeota archaeon BA2]